MSGPIGSSQWMYAIDDGYDIGGSLRFEDGDNAYLKRDLTGDGNRKTYTISFWFKISTLGTGSASDDYRYLYADGKSSSTSNISLSGTDFLSVTINDGSGSRTFRTNRLFRDVTAWYHIVVAVDTTQVTDTDRVKIYINGQQETSFSLSTYPTKDNDTTINKNGNDHLIGKYGGNTNRMWDGYIAEFHLIDGTALAPTSFGKDNNGQWRPIEYSGGNYGVNGFYLNFSSSSFTDNASDPDVFADQAGSNDFNAYKFKASDILLDSPTNNFATLNYLRRSGNPTLKEGSLEAQDSSSACGDSTFQIPQTGKWYFESMTAVGAGCRQGVGDYSAAFAVGTFLGVGGDTGCYQWQDNTTAISINGGTGSATGGGTSAFSANPVAGTPVGVTVDVENLQIYFQADVGSGLEVLGPFSINSAHTNLSPAFNMVNDTVSFNFGADSSFAGRKTSGFAQAQDANGVGDFYYAPPATALALCTSNLSETAIGPNSAKQADDYFNTVLYTGDGATSNAITGIGHQPDFLWIKNRDANVSHVLQDSVRGIGSNGVNFNTLISDTDGAEFNQADADGVSSFDADGFTVGYTNSAAWNENATTYVGWSWKAGGSSNTFNIDGTGYSTASAAGLTGGNIAADAASISKTSGISILKYTGDGSSSPYSTIKHGLDSPPEFYICKSLDSDNADNWVFFHTLLDGTHDFMYLNLNNGNNNSAINFPPTNTTVKVGGNATNENNKNFLMIAMHSVQGFSKFGKYVGNGSTADGTYVNLGFKPSLVMVKRTNTTGNWAIWDATRNEYNVTNNYLFANEANLEVAGTGNSIGIDILSNGWKFRSNAGNWNGTGGTYIYLAFAEMDFKYANAR